MADDEHEPDEPDDWQGDETGGLSPEEVAYRSFSSARRGISETEVREFLQEVAGELAAAVGRERDLLAQIHEREEHIGRLKERIAHPPPPNEEQVLDYLGEETARVLRSAQEAADEIRAKASARAQAVVERAEDEGKRLREAANDVLAERSREAEVAGTVTLHEAEGRAQGVLRQAARDAESEIEAARRRGREMVGEARAVRERILADLGKRRAGLQAELEQLEGVRDQLLAAGRMVRRQLADAVRALTPYEEQQLGELDEALEEIAPEMLEDVAADTGGSPEGEAAETGDDDNRERQEQEEKGAAEPEVDLQPFVLLPEAPDLPELAGPPESAVGEPEAGGTGADGDGASVLVEVEAEAEEEPEPDVPEFVEPLPDVPDFVGPDRPQVDELFARIRAGREDAVDDARAVLAPVPDLPVTAEVEPQEPAEEPPAPTAAPEREEQETLSADAGLLAKRDEVLAPLSQELLRRCKRALQDEQNELLDRLRRERGRAGAEQLLAPLSAQVTDWADVLESAVDQAYGAGRASNSGERATVTAPRRLVSGLAEVLVTPLRERLVTTLDGATGEPGPELEAELSTRIGARYREWRAQELEYRVGDVLAAAYARGVYDAAPEGSQLRWIPAEVGACPDADDNALEPTSRGSSFPTGQPFPPAHPGCRCLIALADP